MNGAENKITDMDPKQENSSGNDPLAAEAGDQKPDSQAHAKSDADAPGAFEETNGQAAASIDDEKREDQDAQESELCADSLEDQLAAAQQEIGKLKDAFLRAKAEEDNVRRRSEKEVANSRKFAVEGFAKEMLNVRDSLKLASSVELAEDADDAVKSMLEGVEITLKQLDAGFAKFALTEISPQAGDRLDPNLHQAMSIVESSDVDAGCILTVIQSGFQLHDRLLRPAMVVVAK